MEYAALWWLTILTGTHRTSASLPKAVFSADLRMDMSPERLVQCSLSTLFGAIARTVALSFRNGRQNCLSRKKKLANPSLSEYAACNKHVLS